MNRATQNAHKFKAFKTSMSSVFYLGSYDRLSLALNDPWLARELGEAGYGLPHNS